MPNYHLIATRLFADGQELANYITNVSRAFSAPL
jgi:hypothetical protein